VKVGRLRLQIGDYSGAIREAEECYNAASTGNTNYIAHALDLMSETLDTATQAAAAIGTEDLTTVQRVLHGYANPSDPRAARLQQLLESARARS
jgi:hypothetical protein